MQDEQLAPVTLEEAKNAYEMAVVDFMAEGCTAFLTHILLCLKMSWNENIKTAQTNSIVLEINPHWFCAQGRRERVGVLAHESWHVASDHCLIDRCGTRDPEDWNAAADYRINSWIVTEGLPLPPHALLETKYFDDKWTTELIYDDLQKQDKENKKKAPQADLVMVSGGDDPKKHGAGPDETAGTMREKLDDIVKEAAVMEQATKGDWGALPGQIQTALEKLFNPKLPWHAILHRYVDSLVKDDYSYQRFNRRYPLRMCMPSMYTEHVGVIAGAGDWSASVSDNDARHITSELQGILDRVRPEALDYVTFDTQIRDILTFNPGDKLNKVKFTGRGGTNLQPVFDHYNKKPPLVLIVFSDLECQPITEKPRYPVIWVRFGNGGHTPSFGKVIQYEPDPE